jgi:CRISPR-associated protein Cas1
MNKAGRQIFYGFYESQAGPARRLLRRYGYGLAKHYQALNKIAV